MYKRVGLIVFFLLLVGCTGGISSDLDSNKKTKKEVVRTQINCTVDDNNFSLILEDGQIVKYIDSVDGELGQETVDLFNEEYLVGINDNDEALRIMDENLKLLDGSCSK